MKKNTRNTTIWLQKNNNNDGREQRTGRGDCCIWYCDSRPVFFYSKKTKEFKKISQLGYDIFFLMFLRWNSNNRNQKCFLISYKYIYISIKILNVNHQEDCTMWSTHIPLSSTPSYSSAYKASAISCQEEEIYYLTWASRSLGQVAILSCYSH